MRMKGIGTKLWRRWVAKRGRWVTKWGRWVAKKGRLLANRGRWVAKLVAPVCGSSLGSNPDISRKYKMGDISTGVANTQFSPPKKYTKKVIDIKYRRWAGHKVR